MSSGGRVLKGDYCSRGEGGGVRRVNTWKTVKGWAWRGQWYLVGVTGLGQRARSADWLEGKATPGLWGLGKGWDTEVVQ